MYKLIFSLISLMLFISVSLFAQRQPMSTNPSGIVKPIVGDTDSEISHKRIREGMTIEGQKVTFRQSGDRINLFTLDGDKRYTCLENLNLERIMQTMKKYPQQGVWRIDGVFTEYGGENYVLIQRAIISNDRD